MMPMGFNDFRGEKDGVGYKMGDFGTGPEEVYYDVVPDGNNTINKNFNNNYNNHNNFNNSFENNNYNNNQNFYPNDDDFPPN